MITFERNTEIIAKENLAACSFSREDVLLSIPERQQRRYTAERATMLGNGYQGKVDIYFRTADGATKRVQTTVWASDAEFVTLKSGASIPLRSIVGFDFY